MGQADRMPLKAATLHTPPFVFVLHSEYSGKMRDGRTSEALLFQVLFYLLLKDQKEKSIHKPEV